MPISEVHNCDCMDFMRDLPGNFFDLAIADPPFGISYARGKNGWGVCDNRPTPQDVKWDGAIPGKGFFDELLRVSKHAIIWGGNYFTHLLPVSKCWIVWDKCDGTPNKSVFADAELAWTNFTKVVRMFHLRQMGFISDSKDTRIHPTQKPTELYHWLLTNYGGGKIFDPMMGSGSSRIAAYKLGHDFWGCEKDKDYFDKSNERFEKECLGITRLPDGTTIKQLSIWTD